MMMQRLVVVRNKEKGITVWSKSWCRPHLPPAGVVVVVVFFFFFLNSPTMSYGKAKRLAAVYYTFLVSYILYCKCYYRYYSSAIASQQNSNALSGLS